MNVEMAIHGGVTVARLAEPRLDAAMSVRFKETMRDLAEEGSDDIILDLQDVTFMDSSGLGAVVSVMKLMGRERTFRIAGLTPAVEKVFKLTRMDSVFEILRCASDGYQSG